MKGWLYYERFVKESTIASFDLDSSILATIISINHVNYYPEKTRRQCAWARCKERVIE